MKIAVASDDGVNVALHTGRCRGFVIYEVAGQAATHTEYRANNFTTHALGQCQGDHAHDSGSSHHSHGPLVDALGDCTVLVTRGLGPRLIADLAVRGIEAYLCLVETAEEAAVQYARGLLSRATGGGCCCRH